MAQGTLHFMNDALGRPIPIKCILPTDRKTITSLYVPENAPMKALYMLEGLISDESSTLMDSNLNTLIEEANLAVFIIGGENKWYANGVDGTDDYQDLIWHDLVNFTRQTFNISRKWEDTYIGGLSMGGGGALVVGMQHPDLFSRIVAAAPAYVESDSINRGQTFAGRYKMEDIQSYDEFAEKMAERGADKQKIYIGCGTLDVLFDWDKAYAEKLKSLGYDVTLYEFEGYLHGHEEGAVVYNDAFHWLPLDRFDKPTENDSKVFESDGSRIYSAWLTYYNLVNGIPSQYKSL